MQKLLYSSWQASMKACHPVRLQTGRRTNRRLVRPPIILSSLFVLLFSCSSLTMARDSDQDGLSDAVEKKLGYDPNFYDSNVDGIIDFHDALRLKLVNAKGEIIKRRNSRMRIASAVVGTDADLDKDKVNDFLETYGYYFSSSKLYSLKRKVTVEEWENFKKRKDHNETVEADSPYRVAAKAMEQKGWKRKDGTVRFIQARNGLRKIFVDKYTANHDYVIGDTSSKGSVNHIYSLLSEFPIQDPGKPYYFTDSNKYSTDFDPLSDWKEVTKVNIGQGVREPADHPLVTAYPVIVGTLKNYTVVIQSSETNLDGSDTKNEWSEVVNKSRSETHGWETKLETETGFPIAMNVKASLGYSGNVTTANGTSNSDGGSKGTITSKSKTTNNACYAHLKLHYAFENIGTAPAYEIKARVNVYIGNILVSSFKTATDFGDLSVGDSFDRLIPEVSSDKNKEPVCLSFESVELLNAGGVIATKVEVDSAKIAYFDEVSHEQKTRGNWTDYIKNAEAGAARIHVKAMTTNGKLIEESYLVHAAGRPLVTIGEALYMTMGKNKCPSHKSDKNTICVGRDRFDTIYFDKENTYMGLHSFDKKGNVLNSAEASAHLKDLTKKAGGSILDIPLEAGWQYSFVKREDKKAVFKEHMVYLESKKFVINTLVSDSFGIRKVEYCRTKTKCLKMRHDLGKGKKIPDELLTPPTLAKYVLDVKTAIPITGDETLRVTNIIGMVTEMRVKNFYDRNSNVKEKTNELQGIVERNLLNAREYANLVPKNLSDQARASGLLKFDILVRIKSLEKLQTEIRNLNSRCRWHAQDPVFGTAKCISELKKLRGRMSRMESAPYYTVPLFAYLAYHNLFYIVN